MSCNNNNFNGEITEYPGVYVDKFNSRGKLFFLTHSHEDHLQGLLNQSFCKRVYCSKLTRDIIKLDPKYKNKVKYLVAKEFNNPFQLSTDAFTVTITMIQTYHCPGSAMFLFETGNSACLVTGDIRAEEWWTSSLVKNRYLFPYIKGFKSLDTIYLDTTFAYRGEPYISIPPNSDGIANLINLLKLYPEGKYDPSCNHRGNNNKKNDNCNNSENEEKECREIAFSFLNTVSGSEEAWFQVADYFKTDLKVPKSIRKRISLLEQAQSHEHHYQQQQQQQHHHQQHHHQQYSLSSQQGNRLIAVGDVEAQVVITIKHAINYTIGEYQEYYSPIDMSLLNTSLLEPKGNTKSGHSIYVYDNRQYIKPNTDSLLNQNLQQLLPTTLLLVFSRHSSYQESINFVRLFKPKLVYPCVSSAQFWKSGFSIERVFGKVCLSESHRYDIEMRNKYGEPLVNLATPVTCVDPWHQNVSEKPFKGQLHFQTSSEYQTWRHNFFGEKLISGRREARYRDIIQYHQKQKYAYESDDDNETTITNSTITNTTTTTTSDTPDTCSNQSSFNDSGKSCKSLPDPLPEALTKGDATLPNTVINNVTKDCENQTDLSNWQKKRLHASGHSQEQTLVSPLLNHNRIAKISKQLKQDRRNWKRFKLKCLHS